MYKYIHLNVHVIVKNEEGRHMQKLGPDLFAAVPIHPSAVESQVFHFIFVSA